MMMTDALAEITARGAVLILSGIGIPVERSGSLISCGGGVFKVTADCAGVRICLAYVFFAAMLRTVGRGGLWPMIAALPLAVAVNIVRASIAVAVPEWHDPIGLILSGCGFLMLLVLNGIKNGR